MKSPLEHEPCAVFPRITLTGYDIHSNEVTQVVDIDGNVVCARCVVATNPFTRMRGLLGRSTLARDEGMLFPRTGSIHMWFMRISLDVVFCDADMVVIDVVRGLRPWRMAMRRGAKSVLELAEGAADGVHPGDRLTVATIDS
jgi:uncharacterized protein